MKAVIAIKKVYNDTQNSQQVKYLNNLRARAFAAANQSSMSPNRYKKWASKNKNMLIGGASLEVVKKRNKRSSPEDYNDYFTPNQHESKASKTLEKATRNMGQESRFTKGSDKLSVLPSKSLMHEPRLPQGISKKQ